MLSVTAMYSFVTIQSYCLGRPTAQPRRALWDGLGHCWESLAVGECWESFAKSPNEDNPARGDLDISSNGLMGERWVLLLRRGSALGAAI
jgi:hypothetical protein